VAKKEPKKAIPPIVSSRLASVLFGKFKKPTESAFCLEFFTLTVLCKAKTIEGGRKNEILYCNAKPRQLLRGFLCCLIL